LVLKTMKIGVISDTHVSGIDQLSSKLVERLYEMDIVVHLGDYTGRGLLEGLREIGAFTGVYGNMDPPSVAGQLPEKDVMVVKGKKLGLIHGWGAPEGLRGRINDCFQGVDAILYGHTHKPENEVIGGRLFFNPGSATGMFPAQSRSFGILDVGDSIRGEIVVIE